MIKGVINVGISKEHKTIVIDHVNEETGNIIYSIMINTELSAFVEGMKALG